MPDFSVSLVGGTQVPWIDPDSASPVAPSRLNPDPAYLHSYRKVPPPLITSLLLLQVTVNGVLTPLDAALGGRLFTATFPEWSGPSMPSISYTPGQSSAMGISLLPAHLGHFFVRVSRPNGGVVGIHFDVEP